MPDPNWRLVTEDQSYACWRGHVHNMDEFSLVAVHRRCMRLVPTGMGVLSPHGHTCYGRLTKITAAEEAAYLAGGVDAFLALRSSDRG